MDISSTAADHSRHPMIVHNVYFALHDGAEQNIKLLLASCKKYLTDHPGTVFFACGTLSDLKREVNDRDFHVGLHVIFKDRASHDEYQVSQRHQQFIIENKPTWKKVRVFDSDVEPAAML